MVSLDSHFRWSSISFFSRLNHWHTAELLSVALCAASVLGGCKISTSPSVSASSPSARFRSNGESGQSANGVIRTGAVYKQAVASYRAHRYADALRLLDTLRATPHLSPQDLAFLERQRTLCSAPLSGSPSASAATTTVAWSPARKSRAVSRSEGDCGPRALLLLCKDQHLPATLSILTRAAHTTKEGTSLYGLTKAAQTVGFQAEGVQMDKNALENLSRPAIAWVDGNHYVAVLNVHQNPWTGKSSVTIHDPNKPEQEEIPPATLLARSGGVLLMLSPPNAKKTS